MKKVIFYFLVACLLLACTNERRKEEFFYEPREGFSYKPKEVLSSKLKKETKVKRSNCSYINQVSDLGVGILMWNYDCDKKITFYKSAELVQEVEVLNPCRDVVNTCPLIYKSDYGILHYAVTQVLDSSFEVMVNGSEKRYIKRGGSFQYASWKNFFENHVLSVNLIDSRDYYDVLSFDGDFLEVKDTANDKTTKLQWRQGNELLVNLILLM